MKINDREIGAGQGVYIIAEMSANHGGDFETAIQIIHAAHDAGADAIKLQTYTPDTITLDCDNEHFQIHQGTIWDGQTLYDLYQSAYTPWEWHSKLQAEAHRLGLDFFSSPFDPTAVDFLETLNVPAYKVASFEINDVGLLKKIGATGKPVIFSTGMATCEEIQLAIDTLRAAGTTELAMLKCTSAYPAMPADMNLATIADMRATFGIPVGLSDHTKGIQVPIAATALGACVIEKHLVLEAMETADSMFSLTPDEFREMVAAVRSTSEAMGQVTYGPTPRDKNNLAFRRSLFVVRDIKAGERFTETNVRSIRPAAGLEPIHFEAILGSVASHDIIAGTPLSWGLVECVEGKLVSGR